MEWEKGINIHIAVFTGWCNYITLRLVFREIWTKIHKYVLIETFIKLTEGINIPFL